ncbi:hypothetical protein [Subtercola vilae]|uniref:Uncharacterized protein n=1 Tax=Subtercola vilae TaxID=2056433 RepID=A0A4T2BV61_9MICO|nr:hypothetical protein [Subtercola vilae]TIH33686.1 hypothetical protein D4765_14485 [Subtercola vilae]
MTYTLTYDKPDGNYHPGETITATLTNDAAPQPLTDSPIFSVGNEQVQAVQIQIVPQLPEIVLSDSVLSWAVVSQDQNTIVLSAIVP